MANYKYFFKRADEPRLGLPRLSNEELYFQLRQEGGPPKSCGSWMQSYLNDKSQGYTI